jgi:hypothetical protein
LLIKPTREGSLQTSSTLMYSHIQDQGLTQQALGLAPGYQLSPTDNSNI